MKHVIKVVLLMCFSFGILAASSQERQEKMKEEREYRKNALLQAEAAAATSAWTPVFTFPGMTIKHYDYRASGVIWAVGFDATTDYALYSNNNGGSWSRVALPATANVGYTNISSNSDSTAVIGDYDGNILRSTNKGATWTKVYTYSNPDSAYFDGIQFLDNNVALAHGDADWYGLHVAKTTDGGATWAALRNLPDSAKGAGRFFSSSTYGQTLKNVGNTVWIAYYSSSAPRRMIAPVLKSTDAGATWTYTEYPTLRGTTNNYYFRSMSFLDGNVGFAVGRQLNSAAPTLLFPLHKTTDGGATWSDTLALAPSGLANNRTYVSYVVPGTKNVFFMGQTGANHGSWMSADSGKTFTAVAAPATAGAFRAIGGTDMSTILAGSGSGVYKYQGSVKVTFIVNTAGLPDTLKTTSFVQIRGGAAQLTWDNNSPAKLVNMGTVAKPSEYWSFTGYFPAGGTFQYKFFTNAKSAITGADKGWEKTSTNRSITVGDNDTTLPVQYVNGFLAADQFAGPFPTNKPDTVMLYLRVNMQQAIKNGIFNPATHKVGVRGSITVADWGTSFIMNKGGQHPDGESQQYDGENFYTIAIPFNKTAVATTPFNVAYKFVIHNLAAPPNEPWDNLVSNVEGDRGGFPMPAKDTTIYWVWYNNVPYSQSAGKDSAQITFKVNMSGALASGSVKASDVVLVQYGFNNSAISVLKDTIRKPLFGTIWSSDPIWVKGVVATKHVSYNYYHVITGTTNEDREIFYDFEFTGTGNEGERRKILVGASGSVVTAWDTAKSDVTMRRMPKFPNAAFFTKNARVRWQCDLRPAYYALANGDSLLDTQGAFRSMGKGDRDSVYKWGVWMNGPAVGGWSNPNGDWGNGLREVEAKKLYDDGTHGDLVAGDRIYSREITYKFDTSDVAWKQKGKVFKFGLNAGDNEVGNGKGFGNNHYVVIDENQDPFVVDEQFGSINPNYYRFWNYDTRVGTLGVDRNGNNVPNVYALEQNFPNPFNPTTSITYSIPMNGLVSLKVYNVLGQEVATVVNTMQDAGSYTASFDASTMSSGVYFYKIEAGSFTSVKKMMLLK